MRLFVTGLILAAFVSCATAPAKTGVAVKRDDPVMLEKRRVALQRKSLERAPQDTVGVVGEVPQDILAKVREDLAARIGDSSIGLKRAESVTWRSGALDCL